MPGTVHRSEQSKVCALWNLHCSEKNVCVLCLNVYVCQLVISTMGRKHVRAVSAMT